MICYIQTTLSFRQYSWVGDGTSELILECYSDADFAGDPRTQISTTGITLQVRGPRSKAVPAVSSKRQTCVSHSTPEAEIVAADEAIRTECLPASLLWDAILRRQILIRFR